MTVQIESKDFEPTWQRVGDAAAVQDGAQGQRFEISYRGRTMPAFAVRYQGQAFAYLNQCAHVAMELDWQPGQFFDGEQRYLICATHAALYEPATGHCVAGPCVGKKLIPLKLKEHNGHLYAATL
jgi:nitrite reductase/ring-hydroxylating ferredoxin subunit